MAISAYYKLGQAYKQKLIECKQLSTDLAAAKECVRMLVEASDKLYNSEAIRADGYGYSKELELRAIISKFKSALDTAKLDQVKQLESDLAAKERERILIEALEWYQEKAIFIKDYLLKKKTDAVMAIVTELSLDNGTKARNALALVKKEK